MPCTLVEGLHRLERPRVVPEFRRKPDTTRVRAGRRLLGVRLFDDFRPSDIEDLLAGGPVTPRPGLCYRDGERAVAVEQLADTIVPMNDVPTPIFDEYF